MGFLKIFLFCIVCSFPWPSFQTDLETYIVQVESPETQISTQSSSSMDLESYYHSFLPKTTTISSSKNEEPRMIYSYHNVLKGFAARLTAAEVKEMEKKQGFFSARPQRMLSLQTTHTPSFLGLKQNMGLWKDSNYGKGVIIGVLDTGIFPDHPSFSDVGMSPPPAKWKGFCESNFTTKCNNKIIGLRSFRLSEDNPIDTDGHGTHTASTAAGAFVKGANFFGNANGTAVGVAPLAHIAIYKVCGFATCSETDALAAMDAAIDDGVDIISASLGAFTNAPLHDDPIALGAYSATERGILVSGSAGNSEFDNPVANNAPWILTVGASTHDRKLKATVKLGNKEEFEGESADQPKTSNSTFIALFDAEKNSSDQDAPFCRSWAMTDPAIKGKIVLCRKDPSSLTSSQGRNVKDAGGVGMILINNPEDGVTKSATAHVLPALDVSHEEGEKIKAYINSTSNPIAAITFQGTVIGDKNAPIVASFSARGPSRANPGILKPDIIGPGVNILAAWPTTVDIPNKNTNSGFNILSGTSMSCAHLTGIAALLKSAHPNWSSSAIKSAIMTTADTLNLAKNPILDETLNPANIFATGAGHVNPSRANDPGLVYDTPFEDYLPYLCGLNYSNREVGFLLQRRVNCSEVKSIPEAQLNYPSFSIRLRSTPQIYTRTVTNVGDATSTYKVEIVSPKGVSVKVKPSKLNFSMLNQRLTYQVTFSKTTNSSGNEVVQGFLKWTSNRHSVRSPIAVVLI